ncbi:hypothetical protein P4V41_20625 [Fictibacillus nanhaiensis]|uniref:hypothetical protein n=1 Tax=Fictibacillus nanhaiensis TaxID=742169 RepID=UPI002E1AD849|nr:hypothetical protein [Fictibacillus nanhaiensis]
MVNCRQKLDETFEEVFSNKMVLSKIRKCLYQTNANERDDLEQEIKIKIMEKTTPIILNNDSPGLWSFIYNFSE